jgi:predicted metalloprotease with PDZ domain
MDGLFLIKTIPENINFLPANDYLDMMANLRQRILATPEQVSELKQTLNWIHNTYLQFNSDLNESMDISLTCTVWTWNDNMQMTMSYHDLGVLICCHQVIEALC